MELYAVARRVSVFCFFYFLIFAVPSFGLERNNLVFYLPFEGSLAPLIAKGNTEIKYKNGTEKDTELVEGRRGTGLKAKEKLSIFYHSKDSFSHREGTIAVWIKPIGWSGDGYFRHFIVVHSDTTSMEFYTYPGNTWFLVSDVTISGPSGYYLIGGRDWHGWKDGKWTFLAGTFQPGQQKWYINGELKSKKIEKLIEPEFFKKGIVQICGGDHVVDELMIFDRVLADNEIMAIYKANMPK